MFDCLDGYTITTMPQHFVSGLLGSKQMKKSYILETQDTLQHYEFATVQQALDFARELLKGNRPFIMFTSKENTTPITWQHNAPINAEFLGAARAVNNQDY